MDRTQLACLLGLILLVPGVALAERLVVDGGRQEITGTLTLDGGIEVRNGGRLVLNRCTLTLTGVGANPGITLVGGSTLELASTEGQPVTVTPGPNDRGPLIEAREGSRILAEGSPATRGATFLEGVIRLRDATMSTRYCTVTRRSHGSVDSRGDTQLGGASTWTIESSTIDSPFNDQDTVISDASALSMTDSAYLHGTLYTGGTLNPVTLIASRAQAIEALSPTGSPIRLLRGSTLSSFGLPFIAGAWPRLDAPSLDDAGRFSAPFSYEARGFSLTAEAGCGIEEWVPELFAGAEVTLSGFHQQARTRLVLNVHLTDVQRAGELYLPAIQRVTGRVQALDSLGIGVNFYDCEVAGWSVYLFGACRLTLRSELFGEMEAYGQSEMTLVRSVVWASYLSAEGSAKVTLRGCQIRNADVHDDTVSNLDIRAIGKDGGTAEVRLYDTPIDWLHTRRGIYAEHGIVELSSSPRPVRVTAVDGSVVTLRASGTREEIGPSNLWSDTTSRIDFLAAPSGEQVVAGLGQGGGGWMNLIGNPAAPAWLQIPWAPGGETHPAAGSVSGGGVPALVVGFGRGAQGWVAVLERVNGAWALRRWFQLPWFAYDTAGGETFPVLGDLDGDGKDECVLGLGPASGGWMPVLTSLDSSPRIARWVQVPWGAYNAVNGETRPAIGDFDGSGRRGLLVGLGAGSQGRMWLTNDLASGLTERGWVQVPWAAYDSANGETRPAAGRPAGALRDRVLVGLGRGGAGWMWSCDPVASTGNWLQLAGPSTWNGETRPASAPGGSRALVGLGPGGDGRMRLFDLADPTRGEDLRVAWEAYDAANGESWPALSR